MAHSRGAGEVNDDRGRGIMSDPTAHRNVVVVGASAGGVEALIGLVSAFPASLPAAVFVVLHVPPAGSSVLPRVLGRYTPMPVAYAVHGEPVVPGRILVAPPDYQLLLDSHRVRLSKGPRENRQRPAVDPLFRSAALAFGPRVIGVVLSGALDDGTGGLLAIKVHGGLAIVQDPNEALFAGMPANALATGVVDHTLPVAGIGALIADRTSMAPEGSSVLAGTGLSRSVTEDEETEMAMIEGDPVALHRGERTGVSSGFSGPECDGVLFERPDDL